ncbi:hypothetical protein RHGRI_007078 [Rhododendron griersonianum]|uniref:Pyruvate kinase n=1 Tax=Rhododendron griersonianum TaxID=479676 RepID=A0AAV6KVI3_9ERIC|nr:hypothetical protein RHGRI_007078 [Rhododendron griersonianum]
MLWGGFAAENRDPFKKTPPAPSAAPRPRPTFSLLPFPIPDLITNKKPTGTITRSTNNQVQSRPATSSLRSTVESSSGPRPSVTARSMRAAQQQHRFKPSVRPEECRSNCGSSSSVVGDCCRNDLMSRFQEPVMLDTVGAELQVVNNTEKTLQLKVILTPDHGQEASSEILPINFSGLSKAVKKGDTIFVGHYLFAGSETTSVWLEVDEVREEDVVCGIKNTATFTGSLFTLHASQVHIDLPTLSDKDKENLCVEFACFSSLLAIKMKATAFTLYFHFDALVLERGVDIRRIFVCEGICVLISKGCCLQVQLGWEPAVVTRVVDSMTGNLRPTRTEATDVANAALDGSDGILLGAGTLHGLYPIETISIVGYPCLMTKQMTVMKKLASIQSTFDLG